MDKAISRRIGTTDSLWRGYKVLDGICAVILVLCPILQHYRGLVDFLITVLFVDLLPVSFLKMAGEDTLTISLMLLMTPYMLWRCLPRLQAEDKKIFWLLSPFMVFYIYKVFDHGTSVGELLQVFLSLCFLLALSMGCIDLKTVIKAATVVACVAGGLMIVQYICYYGFGFHLQLVPTDLLHPSAGQWVAGAKTGRVSVTGSIIAFYRPCAFFLEPAHLFIYCFPPLFINLYKTGKTPLNWVAGVLISLGIVLSTSGMGVAVVFGAWVLFVALWDEKTDTLKLSSLKKLKHWARAVCVVLALVLLFLNVPSINHSLARIIGRKTISISMFLPEGWVDSDETSLPEVKDESLVGDRNAISGRTKVALKVLKNMRLGQWIVGCSDNVADANGHMPGFASIAYRYGVIGLLLTYCFFAYSLLKLDAAYFWMTVIWFVISLFSAHSHGMSYLLYYLLILVRGHQETTGAWTAEMKGFFQGIFRKRIKVGGAEE